MSRENGISVSIEIPNIGSSSSTQIAEIARRRDGRWSEQTQSLLLKFGTQKLDLNRGWASTWTGWTCPCCRRDKSKIARLSPGGVLLCRLELHHDHIVDKAKNIYYERNPRSADRNINIHVSRSEDAIMPLVERFEMTLICIDCNLAEGQAKLGLGGEVDKYFTFSPFEIATFITVFDNSPHKVNLERVRAAWNAAKDDFADRIDFADRMARRIAGGRHRREFARGQRFLEPMQDRDILYDLISKEMPSDYRLRLGILIEERSVSYDSAGQSAKPKRRPRVIPPTESEFAEIESKQGKTWMLAGPEWLCPCCGRSKREICRKSNSGLWFAKINRVTEYLQEDNEESIIRRRIGARSELIIGSRRQMLICHDCRNISAELQRRRPGFYEGCLTLDDIRELVGSATPHSPHDIDFERATTTALANASLIVAIEDYDRHCSLASETLADVKRLAQSMPWHKARDIIGCELAEANGWELEEGDAHADWLLEEAYRIRELELGFAKSPGGGNQSAQ